ncbi:hypothetical protein Thiosp_01828 [Thiorhodovibrio litoralis]|nr:hypothetical protein [Thiorhodovibrio winogradskyi]WPL12072.1 hypothetical protein Thiosp_01828 [Thiorhodovibrio litoralis]
MPSILGLVFTAFGIWYLFAAFRRRNEVLRQRTERQAAREVSDHGGSQQKLDPTTPADDAPRPNPSMQRFASGCAPVVALAVVMGALGVAAIALVMDGPRRISIFDILSLLFFAGAFAYSLMMQTFYSSAFTSAEDNPDTSSAQDSEPESGDKGGES